MISQIYEQNYKIEFLLLNLPTQIQRFFMISRNFVYLSLTFRLENLISWEISNKAFVISTNRPLEPFGPVVRP